LVAAGSFHPIHPPFKKEVARRAWLWADNVAYGNASSPTSGPVVSAVIFDPYEPSWGNYHYGIQQGVCAEGTGFTCAGIRIVFDRPIAFRPFYTPVNAGALIAHLCIPARFHHLAA